MTLPSDRSTKASTPAGKACSPLRVAKGPQPVGALLESSLRKGNTPGWVKLLEVHPVAQGPSLYAPQIPRDRGLVDAKLRGMVNLVVTGRAPWPLTLLGGVGSGKTRAALCLLDAVGGGCIYREMRDLCEETTDAMQGRLYDQHHGAIKTLRQFWGDWRGALLTVLDEIGAREKVSDHHYDCLKRALDSREGLPCVYISNLTLEEIAAVYDDRVASRLAQGTLVTMAGQDRRLP